MNILKKIRQKKELKSFRSSLEKNQIVFVKMQDKRFDTGTFSHYENEKESCIVYVSGYGFISKKITEIHPVNSK